MSVKQRAYPVAGEQLHALVNHIGQVRFVYNIALEQRNYCDKTARERGVKISSAQQMRQLTEARKDFDWLREGSTVVQQGALRDLNTAFTNFFEGRARYPKFKRRSRNVSFVVRDISLKRLNKRYAAVLVPKAGWLKFRLSYAWTVIHEASSARVSFHNGRWYVSLTTPPRPKYTEGVGTVGLDRGVRVSVMTDEAQEFHAPSLTANEQARFTALERELARRDKRSKNRERTKLKLAALRRRLLDRRTDWIEKSTTELARTYAVASVEKLNVTAMVKNPAPKPDPERPGEFLPNGAAAKTGLARSIHASQWGKFVQRLNDKMEIAYVPAANTSLRCFECKHVSKENRESQAVFRCVKCKHVDDADVNASKNIRHEAVCGRTCRARAETAPAVDAKTPLPENPLP